MKKILITITVLSFAVTGVMAQKYFTKNGRINFSATSSSSPERVEGVNRSVTCVMDIQTGNIQFAALMKGFEFERALMEEHFNENYVESDKFPKAEFKGSVADYTPGKFSKNGTYDVKVIGTLTMHGESKQIESSGKIIVENGKISTSAGFSVLLKDFNISVPTIVADKVAKMAKIEVNCSLEPFKG